MALSIMQKAGHFFSFFHLFSSTNGTCFCCHWRKSGTLNKIWTNKYKVGGGKKDAGEETKDIDDNHHHLGNYYWKRGGGR